MKTRSIGVSVLSFWRAAEMRHRLISLAIVLAAIVPATGAPIFGLPESAIPFGLLGESVSNTGTSYVVGDVGATSTNTGFPPGMASGFVCPPVTGGPACTGAEDTAVTTAYNAIFNSVGDAFSTAESLTPTPGDTFAALTSQTFLANTVSLFTGDVTTTTGTNLIFNAGGDPNAVFVIQIDGAFSVIGAMTFQLEGGALASNIFWIVEGGAATISVGTSGPITFDGDILAATAFTMSASGQTGGSGVLAGTINGCVFTDTGENTLAGETDVNGCLATGSPEPGTAGLAGLGCVLGILVWRRVRP